MCIPTHCHPNSWRNTAVISATDTNKINSYNDILAETERRPRCLQTWSAYHPLTQRHISEQRRLQLHRCENLKTRVAQTFITQTKRPTDFWQANELQTSPLFVAFQCVTAPYTTLLLTSQSTLGTDMTSNERAESIVSVTSVLNHLKPSGNYMYRQFYIKQF